MQQRLKATISALSCYVPVCVSFFEHYWVLYSNLSGFHQDISAAFLIPLLYFLNSSCTSY